MRYVTIEKTDEGGFLADLRSYLPWLREHGDELPPGARDFALHPEHYDFTHEWCPRSATFDRMSSRSTQDGVDTTLVLRASGHRMPEFVVRYRGVVRVELDGDHGRLRRSDLLVDEILPHPDGVSHELAFAGGTVTVVARDFTAGWSPKGGANSPKDDRDAMDHDNPATHARRMRLYPRMYVLDDRFLTLATAVHWYPGLWQDGQPWQFQGWVGMRLTGRAGPLAWPSEVERHVAPDVPRDAWTDEHHAAAISLMFDLLEEYLAEQGFVAS